MHSKNYQRIINCDALILNQDDVYESLVTCVTYVLVHTKKKNIKFQFHNAKIPLYIIKDQLKY